MHDSLFIIISVRLPGDGLRAEKKTTPVLLFYFDQSNSTGQRAQSNNIVLNSTHVLFYSCFAPLHAVVEMSDLDVSARN